MEVRFRTNKLRKECEDPRVAKKSYGNAIGNKLTQRISELIAATSLKNIELIPSSRLHPLRGRKTGLVHPYRLVISPVNGPNTVQLTQITIVRIEEVEDYHGKQKKR